MISTECPEAYQEHMSFAHVVYGAILLLPTALDLSSELQHSQRNLQPMPETLTFRIRVARNCPLWCIKPRADPLPHWKTVVCSFGPIALPANNVRQKFSSRFALRDVFRASGIKIVDDAARVRIS